ncbi:hypothetical protein ACLKA6_010307 [Drosophila palustris]
MDAAHSTVGMLGKLALVLIMSHTTSQVLIKASTPVLNFGWVKVNSHLLSAQSLQVNQLDNPLPKESWL